MTYPQWWERLLAAVIDGLIFVVVSFVLSFILVGLAGLNLSAIKFMTMLSGLILTALMIAYKVLLESSAKGATVGKMAFGLRVVGHDGGRVSMKTALMRTWPWWLNLLAVLGGLVIRGQLLNIVVLLALIAIFVTFFLPPISQCIHDQTAKCYVIKSGKSMLDN